MEQIYRLDLKKNEFELLKEIFKNVDKIHEDDRKSWEGLFSKFHNPKIITKSIKKAEAAKKVALSKLDTSIQKIDNAINILKLYGKKITIYKVAKEAGISYNTAKKHILSNKYFRSLVEIE